MIGSVKRVLNCVPFLFSCTMTSKKRKYEDDGFKRDPVNNEWKKNFTEKEYYCTNKKKNRSALYCNHCGDRVCTRKGTSAQLKVSSLYDHMDAYHKEKYINNNTESILDRLLNAIPTVIKKRNWPFRIGFNSHKHPGNMAFQDSVLKFCIDNNVTFHAVSTESY